MIYLVLAVVALFLLKKLRKRKGWLNQKDLLRSFAIFGGTGSGKTRFSGYYLGKEIIEMGCGMLICAAKPDDRAMWEGMFKGRELKVFEPREKWRFNLLDYFSLDDARNVTRCIMNVSELLGDSDAKGGEDSEMWEKQQARMIHNGVEILKLAKGKFDAWDLQRFITGAAKSPSELHDPAWRAGFHNEMVGKAHLAAAGQHDYELASSYFIEELPRLASKTRTSIEVGVMQTLHVFNSGVTRNLLSQGTNITPDNILKGEALLVNMPPSSYGDTGAFVSGAWKYAVQQAVLRRKTWSVPVVIWCDEASQFFNSHDAIYLAQSRGYGGCMVYLAQSLHSYYSKGDEHQVDGLLTNFSTKIFHALGDIQTASYASNLIGRRKQLLMNGNMPGETSPFGAAFFAQSSGGFSEHIEAVIEPGQFINNLRTGKDGVADAIVIRNGERFANGENWLKVSLRR